MGLSGSTGHIHLQLFIFNIPWALSLSLYIGVYKESNDWELILLPQREQTDNYF